MSKLMNLQTDFDDSLLEKKLVSWTVRVPPAANFPEEAETPTRYVLRLPSFPYLADQITYPITVGALTKVTTAPASGQFRIVDGLERTRPHLIEFNSAQANNTYTISYYAIGSILDIQQMGFVTSGFDASVPMYVFNERDHGTDLTRHISDLPSGDKVVFLKNGDYNITSQLVCATYNLLGLIGQSRDGVIITSSVEDTIIQGSVAHLKHFTLKTSFTGSGKYAIGNTTATDYSRRASVDDVAVIDTNGSGNTIGFFNLVDLINCYADNYFDNFKTCVVLNNCFSTLASTGFQACDSLNNCTAYNNSTAGFTSCDRLQGCIAKSNATGFSACNRVLHCLSVSNTAYGFTDCAGLSYNKATSNTTQNYNQTGYNYADIGKTVTYRITNANGLDTYLGGFNV